MGGISKLLEERPGELAIEQLSVNGWPITWNPDDSRFHVERLDRTSAAAFKELRNARTYARTHTRS